jgi:hypothetical protein
VFKTKSKKEKGKWCFMKNVVMTICLVLVFMTGLLFVSGCEKSCDASKNKLVDTGGGKLEPIPVTITDDAGADYIKKNVAEKIFQDCNEMIQTMSSVQGKIILDDKRVYYIAEQFASKENFNICGKAQIKLVQYICNNLYSDKLKSELFVKLISEQKFCKEAKNEIVIRSICIVNSKARNKVIRAIEKSNKD